MSTTLIHDTQQLRQAVDFSSLQFKSKNPKIATMLWPTDVDALMDFDNRLFVFIELKYGDAPLPVGQELALRRLVNAVEDSGREACLICASHTQPTGETIAAGSCKVLRVWKCHGWWDPDIPGITVREQVCRMLQNSADPVLAGYVG